MLRSILAACVLCASWPAGAVLIRTDRDDAEYLELASRYPSSIRLAAPAGEGVLIQQGWILTTPAHAKALARRNATVTIDGVVYDVDEDFAHPKEGLALVRLKAPVRNLAPTRLYKARDESGKAIAVVGHGATAKGAKGDGRTRAGINTIDAVTPTTLVLRTKSGDDASDLQGVLAPGEEGAGGYVEVDDAVFLAGLYVRDGEGGNVLLRLSAFADWIEATMVGAERDALKAELEK